MVGRKVTTVLVLFLIVPAHASAQEQPPATPESAGPTKEERARELTDKGLAHYAIGEYDEAIAAFKEAYALLPAPGFLYNIAQAYRQKGDCAMAVKLYRSYLDSEPEAANRDAVEELVTEMDECIKTEERKQKEAEAAAAEAAARAARPPPPKIVVREVDRTPPGQAKKIAGVTTAAAGIVLLSTSAFFGLRARSAASEVQELFDEPEGGVWDGDHAVAQGRGKAYERAAIVTASVGAAALVTGGVLYFLGYRAGRSEQSAQVTATRGGATGAVTWQF